MAGDTPQSNACSHCCKPTTKTCGRCSGAPIYDEAIDEATFYCDAVCQKAHWEQHKPTCQALRGRKKLRRAASLLQQAFLAIQRHASPVQFEAASTEGSRIYVVQRPPSYYDLATKLQLRPFSVPLEEKPDLFNAALASLGCTEAMEYLYTLAKVFLTGVCSQVEEIAFIFKNPIVRIVVVRSDGKHVDEEQYWHQIYRVTMKNGEKWVLDPTGIQYGITSPFHSWHSFEKQHSSKIEEVSSLGHTRQSFLVPFSKPLTEPAMAMIIEKEALLAKIERFISTFPRNHGCQLGSLLKGSDSAWDKNQQSFLCEFEATVK